MNLASRYSGLVSFEFQPLYHQGKLDDPKLSWRRRWRENSAPLTGMERLWSCSQKTHCVVCKVINRMNWVGMLCFAFPFLVSHFVRTLRHVKYIINHTAVTLNIFVNWKKAKLTSSDFYPLVNVLSIRWTNRLSALQSVPRVLSFFFSFLYVFTALVDLGRFFSFLFLYTVGRTPWTRDEPFARPLST
jgi:hypothetical protein